MHLIKMRISGEPPFTAPVTFNLDERVNLFVGPNGSGKTTILLMLADCLIGRDEAAKRPIARGWDLRGFILTIDDDADERASRPEPMNFLTGSPDWVGTSCKPLLRNRVNPPVIHVGSIREGLPGVSDIDDLAEYGETVGDALSGRFSGIRTMRVCDLLAKKLWSEEIDESRPYARVILMRAIELADACSQSICSEIVKDSQSHNYIPGPDIRGFLHHPHAPHSDVRVLRMMGINTTDVRNFGNLPDDEEPSYSAYYESPDSIPIYLGHLSSGTEGTLLWIRWLVLKMLHHCNFAEGWEKQPAILLIDEIENHLHPTWQRRVIPALLEHFPGLQIFATTHSPFVVAGLKAGQVHLLNRGANGVITASTNTEDIVGWTADEILRTLMGVDDPTDDTTAAAARELRQLRDEGPRADESEEERRQVEMQRLRRLVNRDLLAGGPREAQRELFEQQFAEALEKYLQSQDLNQDNG